MLALAWPACAQPAPNYQLSDDAPIKSPDGMLTIEQYVQQPMGDSAHFESRRAQPRNGSCRGNGNNYASLGERWPDSRYVVIDLSSGESATYPLGPWRCVYDKETGRFSIPPEMARFNREKAKAHEAERDAWKKNHS